MTKPLDGAAYLAAHSVANPDTGCLEWSGARFSNGYGNCGRYRGGRNLLAHRLSWETFIGPIPQGLLVCHHCDNRVCINPSHLFLGTQKQNIGDAVAKGRFQFGSRNGRAKLTEGDIGAILGLCVSGTYQKDVAKMYGVSVATISRVVRGNNWGRVRGAL